MGCDVNIRKNWEKGDMQRLVPHNHFLEDITQSERNFLLSLYAIFPVVDSFLGQVIPQDAGQ